MTDRGRSASVTAYRSVAAHGGVAAADPHRLIVMLMDGALERIAAARGAIEHGSTEARSRMIHRVVAIIDELRASLNIEAGGEIAANLADLYDYTSRQLMRANLESTGRTAGRGGPSAARNPQCVDPDSCSQGAAAGCRERSTDSWRPAGTALASTGCDSINHPAGPPRPRRTRSGCHPAPDGGTAANAAAIVCRGMRCSHAGHWVSARSSRRIRSHAGALLDRRTRGAMYEGVDTVILQNELAYEDVLPVAWRPLARPLDDMALAALTDRNVQILQVCARHRGTGRGREERRQIAAFGRPHAAGSEDEPAAGPDGAIACRQPDASDGNRHPLQCAGRRLEQPCGTGNGGEQGLLDIYLRDCLRAALTLIATS